MQLAVALPHARRLIQSIILVQYPTLSTRPPQRILRVMPPSTLVIDPNWFRPDAISAETAAFNERFEAQFAEAPSVMELGVAETRALRREGQGPFAVQVPVSTTAVGRTVQFENRQVDVRIFRPASGTITGVYLHIHGGGWCLGASDLQDGALQPLADRASIAVVSVEYRLAPEHTFPAGPDDCETAARWLLTEGPSVFGTDRFVIGGESAGAHLSALTLLRLRGTLTNTGFIGASLVYGAYDLGMPPSARNWGKRRLVLSTPIIEWFCDQFLPPEQFPPARRQSADISPMFSDLAGMPPALFTVGTLDPLLDDTLMMAARWTAAGNRAELAVYPGGIHGFDLFDQPLAQESNDRQTAFIIDVLKG